MRVLFITSGIETVHESLDWYIIHALEELAEERAWTVQVYHLTARRLFARTALKTMAHRLGIQVTTADQDEIANEGMLQQVFSFRPDLCIFMHGGYTNSTVLKILRDYGFRTAVWIVDDPYEIDGSLEYVHEFDLVFTVDRGAAEWYRTRGLDAHTLPLGTSPEVWYPRPTNDHTSSDLLFAGTGFPSRIAFFTDLQERMRPYRFLLMGQWWDRLPEGHPYRILQGLVSPRDVAQFVAGSRLPVNIHRGSQDPAFFEGNRSGVPALTPNNRTFDIAGAGKVQMVDYREDMKRYFEPDEVLTFRDANEFADLAEFYLRPEQEAALQRMGEKARRHVLAAHTFRHRLLEIFAIAEGKGHDL